MGSTYKEHFCEGQRVAKCVTCGCNRPERYVDTDEPCLRCEDEADSVRIRAAKKEHFEILNGPKNDFDVTSWVRI